MRHPLMPAMKAPMANPMSLIRTTLTPAAAAERSLARTASMAEPSRLRRSRATPMAATTSTKRQRGLNPRTDAEVEAEEHGVWNRLTARAPVEAVVLEPHGLDRHCQDQGDDGH